MVRVIMHGCNGRMGQVITEMIAKEAEMEIVAGVDVSDSVHNTYPVFKTLKDCDVEADVVIDFANAKAVDGLLDTCVCKKPSLCFMYDRTFGRTACACQRGFRQGCDPALCKYVHGHQPFDEAVKGCGSGAGSGWL